MDTAMEQAFAKMEADAKADRERKDRNKILDGKFLAMCERVRQRNTPTPAQIAKAGLYWHIDHLASFEHSIVLAVNRLRGCRNNQRFLRDYGHNHRAAVVLGLERAAATRRHAAELLS